MVNSFICRFFLLLLLHIGIFFVLLLLYFVNSHICLLAHRQCFAFLDIMARHLLIRVGPCTMEFGANRMIPQMKGIQKKKKTTNNNNNNSTYYDICQFRLIRNIMLHIVGSKYIEANRTNSGWKASRISRKTITSVNTNHRRHALSNICKWILIFELLLDLRKKETHRLLLLLLLWWHDRSIRPDWMDPIWTK